MCIRRILILFFYFNFVRRLTVWKKRMIIGMHRDFLTWFTGFWSFLSGNRENRIWFVPIAHSMRPMLTNTNTAQCARANQKTSRETGNWWCLNSFQCFLVHVFLAQKIKKLLHVCFGFVITNSIKWFSISMQKPQTHRRFVLSLFSLDRFSLYLLCLHILTRPICAQTHTKLCIHAVLRLSDWALLKSKNNGQQFVQTFDLKRSNTQHFLRSKKNNCHTQPQAWNELNLMFTKHCGILTSFCFNMHISVLVIPVSEFLLL